MVETTETMLRERRSLESRIERINRRLAADNPSPDTDDPLSWILWSVSAVFEVPMSVLFSRIRPDFVSVARHAFYYVARTRTELSLQTIGEWLGGRDHGTVLHGMNACRDRMATDRRYAAKVQEVEARL